MRNNVITKAEKTLAKGLIQFALENGFEVDELDAVDLENQLRRITGNNNCEHRDYIEQMFLTEIEKLKAVR